jgi:hypothetical protein
MTHRDHEFPGNIHARKRPPGLCLALLLAGIAPLAASETASSDTAPSQPAELSLPAPHLPPELFPGAEKLDPIRILGLGLEREFPNRVLAGEPPPLPAGPEAPLRRSLGTRGEFLRAGSAAQAVASLQEAPAGQTLVLDLRRTTSTLEDALRLGSLLSGSTTELPAIGNVPTAPLPAAPSAAKPTLCLVLTGPATSGPLEAVLDQLAASGAIVTVGGPTAGRTGHYGSQAAFPGWLFLVGEHLGASRASLLGKGSAPLVPVTDYLSDAPAYDALGTGATIEAVTQPKVDKTRFGEAELLRAQARSRNGGRPQAETPGEDGPTASPAPKEETPTDSTLQRALAIVTALEVLDRMPKRGT